MRKIHYSDAVPPIPEHFKEAIAETLGGLEHVDNIHRRKSIPVLAIVYKVAVNISVQIFVCTYFHFYG